MKSEQISFVVYYDNEGNFTSAIDSLQRAVQLSPEDLGAKQLLASAKQMG